MSEVIFFGIANAGQFPSFDHIGVDVDACDAEGPEEIALAAFVDSDAGIEEFGLQGGLVAKLRFLEHEGFEFELDEFGGFLALDDEFAAFVENDVEIGPVGGKAGVGYGAGFEIVLAEVGLEEGGLFRS